MDIKYQLVCAFTVQQKIAVSLIITYLEMPWEGERPVLLSSHRVYSLAMNTGPYTNALHYSSMHNNNREKMLLCN